MRALRVAGLPSEAARAGKLAQASAQAAELARQQQAIATAGEQLADLLYLAVGGCEDQQARRALLKCRRAVHNGKPPTALPPGAADRLEPSARALLAQLEDDHRELAATYAAARYTFATEQLAAERSLASVAADEDFRCALAMASDALLPDVEAWLAGSPEDTKHADTRRRVVAYVMRAAMKTSPFSTLTSAGLIDRAPAGAAAPHLPAPAQLRRHTELNAELEYQLERLLTDGYGARVLRTNPTLIEAGEQVLLVRPDGRCVGVRAQPWLLRITAEARHGCEPAHLREVVCAELAANAADASAVLERLVGVGVLQADLGVPDQAPDRLATIADKLQLPGDDPVRRVLTLVRQVAECHVPAQRWQTLIDLRQEVRAALTARGGGESLIPRKHLCYEDAAPVWAAPVAEPAWEALEPDLQRIRKLIALFDGALPGQLAIAHWLRQRYGDRPVGVIPGWLAWQQDNAAGGGRLQQLRDNPFYLEGSDLDQVNTLHWLQRRIVDTLLKEPPDSATVRVDPAILDGLLAEAPSWLPTHHPTTLFLQPLADHTAVLNTAAAGYGTATARLRRLSQRRAAPPPDNGQGPVRVEVAGLFRTTLNRLAPVASHELVWPGCVPSRDADHQVRPADLEIRLRPETGLPSLWWRTAQREVELVYPGAMARFWFPPVLRFLLDLATPQPVPLVLAARAHNFDLRPAAADISVLPRLWIGRVLLDRRTWVVPRASVPGAGTDDFDLFARVRAWAQQLQLPEVVFVRAHDANEFSGRVTVSGKGRKPRPLDLCSWWGVDELARIARGEGMLVIQEAVPDQFGPDRVVEYAVEVPGPGGSQGDRP